MDICKYCGVSGGTHVCNSKDVSINNLLKTIVALERQVKGWKESSKYWEKDCLKNLEAKKKLQAEIYALYALPVVAYIENYKGEANNLDFISAKLKGCIGNYTVSPLVSLPPRGEV